MDLAHKLPGIASSYVNIKMFAKDKVGMPVLLMIDNTTALSYTNNHGGTVFRELVSLT